MKNKEIIINNENAHLLAEKSALEKNLKKHSMFINALSWKKFNANKKKSGDGSGKSKGLAFRTPLDNIHPLVDNNKNIQNALCHGSKSTSLTESSRNLDIARNAVSVGSGSGAKSAIQAQANLHNTNITAASQQQQKTQHPQLNSASSNGNGPLPTNTSNTTRDVQTTQQQCNSNLSNKNFQLTHDKTHFHIRKEKNDNEDPLKKLVNNNNNNIKTETLVKPAPKKTVIQVNLCLSSLQDMFDLGKHI